MSERIIYITKEPYDYRLCICSWRVSESRGWTNYLPEVLDSLYRSVGRVPVRDLLYLTSIRDRAHVHFTDKGKVFKITYHADERSIRGLHPFDCLFVGPSNRDEIYQCAEEFLIQKSIGDICD